MDSRWFYRVLAAAVVALVALCVSAALRAEPITFRLCGGSAALAFHKVGDKLEVRCTGTPNTAPAQLTILGCVGPAVKRLGADYTVTCASWNAYQQVPKG